MSITKLFKKTIAVFALLFIFSLPACADLLSALPAPKDGVEASFRIENVGKTISSLFPSKLFAALNTLSADLGVQDAVKAGMLIEAVKDSNLREFVGHLFFKEGDTQPAGLGCAGTITGANDFFKKATDTGNFTLFDLVKAIGGQRLVDVMEMCGGEVYSLSKCTFQRGVDGIFAHEDNYVMLVGNTVISYLTKDDTISAAKNFKDGAKPRFSSKLNADVLFIRVSKSIMGEVDFLSEIGMNHLDNGIKINGTTNAFKAFPSIAKKFEKKNDLNVPIIGSGKPFYALGGNFYINGVQDIEDAIMMADDHSVTGVWANFLSLATNFGITKQDIGNLLSGAFGMVFGIDENILGLDVPLGAYIALTGTGGAAGKVVNAIFEAFAEMSMLTESKVDGWDKVYSAVEDSPIPNVVAQKGETLVLGMMSPENLNVPLALDELGVQRTNLAFWFNINFERIWNASKAIFSLKTVFESLTQQTPNKELDDSVARWMANEIPVKNFGLWLESPEKFTIDFASNPKSTPDFWIGLFEVINNVGK